MDGEDDNKSNQEEEVKKVEWENLTEEMATEAIEIYDECFDKTGEGKIETSELKKFL